MAKHLYHGSLRRAALALLFCAAASSVYAAEWNEAGDAGPLVGNAQVPVGLGPLTAIHGHVVLQDVDVYRIVILDPLEFRATTQHGTHFDSQLFLFNTQGVGVWANDDVDYDNHPEITTSLLDPPNTIAEGEYLLALSIYDVDAVDLFGQDMFPDNTHPGSTNPLAGWLGRPVDVPEGNYLITLTGAGFAGAPTPVPEPATLLLLGLGGVLALVGRRRLPA